MLLSIVQGKYTLRGTCPTSIATVDNFEPANYTGRWYEVRRDSWIPFEVGTKCVTATYAEKPNGDIKVTNRGVYKFIGYRSQADGAARLDRDEQGDPTGKLTVDFSRRQTKLDRKPNYNILKTDYVNFSVVYSCSQGWFGMTETVWFLAREPEPSDDVMDEMEQFVLESGFSYVPGDSMTYTTQGDDNCDQYPY